jgi:hypothetical protein
MNVFARLFELIVGYGAWLWGIGPLCVLVWLLVKRKAMLASTILWKPMAFSAFGIASFLTLLFWVTTAVKLLPGADFDKRMGFYFLTFFMSPLVFITGAGIGLAYSVLHERARLKTRNRLMALALSGVAIAAGVGLMFPAWNAYLNTWVLD